MQQILNTGIATAATAREYGLQANACRESLSNRRYPPMLPRFNSKDINVREAAAREMAGYVRECWERYNSAINEYNRALGYFRQVLQLETQVRTKDWRPAPGPRAETEINSAQGQVRMLQDAAENMRKFWAQRGIML